MTIRAAKLVNGAGVTIEMEVPAPKPEDIKDGRGIVCIYLSFEDFEILKQANGMRLGNDNQEAG